jgi:hypothetical protein
LHRKDATQNQEKGEQAMTQTAKHSPTPWQDNDAGLIYGQVSGDHDEAPFVCDVCENQPDYSKREKANAALIVRAVNSHKQLVRACRLLVNAYAKAEMNDDLVNWQDVNAAHDAAALALGMID